jgi:integrin beta 3
LLSEVKVWRPDEITYRGEVVSFSGSCFQAVKDTASVPPGKDWRLLAAAGGNGRSMRIRGVYRESETYEELDVVTMERAWFVAKCNAPGPCPGPNWLAGPIGKKGDKGLPGECGPQGRAGKDGKDGKDAIEWRTARVDGKTYSIIVTMSDGSEITLALRDLFEQYDFERKGV